MNIPRCLTSAGIILTGLSACNQPSPISGEKPNIIFILADDLGYTDVNSFAAYVTGAQVSEMYYETPNLNKLTESGIAFSQAYANPLCAPTRASLLTGKHAARLGFTTAVPFVKTYYNTAIAPPDDYYIHDVIHFAENIDFPQAWINPTTNTAIPRGYEIDKGKKEIVITDIIKDYHSAFIGKWHVGGIGADGYQPEDFGFESIAWFDFGGSHYYNWRDQWNSRNKDLFPDIPQEEWVRGNAGELSEFEYLTDDLTEKAVSFIKKKAEVKDKPFFLYLCHFAVHLPFQAPEENIKYFDEKKTIGWNEHFVPIYAAMIKKLDDGLGRIMQTLKDQGLEENTLIIFMSDNGGLSYNAPQYEFPVITSNAPLKGGKAFVYEGGIRVPLIFSWKDKIKPNQWCDMPVDCNDIFPTILEVAGHSLKNRNIDGESLVGLWFDPVNSKNHYKRNTFFWHYPYNLSFSNPDDGFPCNPHSAIRKGDYKLIFDWYGRLKLYNIRKDIAEKDNLMKKEPQRTKELFTELINFLEENVEKRYWPIHNPDYNPDEEVRDVPYVDLYKAFSEGKDVVEIANL